MHLPDDGLLVVASDGTPDAARSSAYRLLRLLLSVVTGLPPEEHVFVRRCHVCGRAHGKPRLAASPLHVSLSYSGGAVAAAVTAVGPVGVDVEEVGRTAFDGFDAVALAPGEQATGTAGRARAWVRKEAYLKATGSGLTSDPRTVDVRREQVAGPPLGQLFDVPSRAGTACAAAVLTPRRPQLLVVRPEQLLTAAEAAPSE